MIKTIYLENTSHHHDKFYHMIENKDGVSFTASWGRIGTTGRTQIYSMNEWSKIYNSKINKGYKVSTNGIQGMSTAQRKKQGITTVTPIHSHQDKLKKLREAMEDWAHDSPYGKMFALDSKQGRMYEADLYKVDELLISGRDILTKKEMLEMNAIFKTYGGKRKTYYDKSLA